FLDPRVDVGLVVRGGRRLEVVGVFGGETRFLSVEHTLPSGLVERAVVDTAGVVHLAGTDGLDLSGRLRVVGRLGGLGGCGRVGGGGGVRRRFGGLGRGRCSRGVGGTVVTTGGEHHRQRHYESEQAQVFLHIFLRSWIPGRLNSPRPVGRMVAVTHRSGRAERPYGSSGPP